MYPPATKLMTTTIVNITSDLTLIVRGCLAAFFSALTSALTSFTMFFITVRPFLQL
jgi:hypothetical protein